MSVSADRREAARLTLASLADRMREDSINAILSMVSVGRGTLVISVPRSHSDPIEATVITGGLQLRLFEDREIRSA